MSRDTEEKGLGRLQTDTEATAAGAWGPTKVLAPTRYAEYTTDATEAKPLGVSAGASAGHRLVGRLEAKLDLCPVCRHIFTHALRTNLVISSLVPETGAVRKHESCSCCGREALTWYATNPRGGVSCVRGTTAHP